VNATIFNDDHGATWHRGDIAVASTPEFPDPNETAAVELSDGRVMLNVRTEAKEHRRVIVTSRDGATHWSEPHFQEDLPDPICFASLVRYPARNLLLFVNPDNPKSKDRVNLTVRMSDDDGAQWRGRRTIEPGATGYADLAVMPDRTILCLYETVPKLPDGSARHDEMLARFNLEWLTGP
jgi:sialidase-1